MLASLRQPPALRHLRLRSRLAKLPQHVDPHEQLLAASGNPLHGRRLTATMPGTAGATLFPVAAALGGASGGLMLATAACNFGAPLWGLPVFTSLGAGSAWLRATAYPQMIEVDLIVGAALRDGTSAVLPLARLGGSVSMRSSMRLGFVHGAASGLGIWLGFNVISGFHGLPAFAAALPTIAVPFLSAPLAVLPAAIVSGSLGCILGGFSALGVARDAAPAVRGLCDWLVRHRARIATALKLSPLITALTVASIVADNLGTQLDHQQQTAQYRGSFTSFREESGEPGIRWSSSKFTEVDEDNGRS